MKRFIVLTALAMLLAGNLGCGSLKSWWQKRHGGCGAYAEAACGMQYEQACGMQYEQACGMNAPAGAPTTFLPPGATVLPGPVEGQ